MKSPRDPPEAVPTLGRIRRVIAQVPRGRVATYGQVAELAGFPRAARLTVWALQRSEGLAWHRIVAVGGRIALAGGEGDEQRWRLRREGVTFRGGRVRMDRHAWKPRRARRPTSRPRAFRDADRDPLRGVDDRGRIPFDDTR